MSNSLAGVWIDLKVAIIVHLEKNNHTIEKIESDIETRERVKGDNDHSGRFGETNRQCTARNI